MGNFCFIDEAEAEEVVEVEVVAEFVEVFVYKCANPSSLKLSRILFGFNRVSCTCYMSTITYRVFQSPGGADAWMISPVTKSTTRPPISTLPAFSALFAAARRRALVWRLGVRAFFVFKGSTR